MRNGLSSTSITELGWKSTRIRKLFLLVGPSNPAPCKKLGSKPPPISPHDGPHEAQAQPGFLGYLPRACVLVLGGRLDLAMCVCVRMRSPREFTLVPPLAAQGCGGLLLLRLGQDREQWWRPEPGASGRSREPASTSPPPPLYLSASVLSSSSRSAEAASWEGSGASVRFPADGQPLGALRGRATSR